MGRMGYSSAAILEEVRIRHFVETPGRDAEIALREMNASPALIEAIKSNQNAASPTEMANLSRAAEATAESRRVAQQSADQQLAEQQAAEQEAEARKANSPQPLVVAELPRQPAITFLTPSEKAAAARAEEAAREAAREQYCLDHPVECETLRVARQTQSDANEALRDAREARRSAEEAKRNVDSLKWKLQVEQGLNP